MCWFINVGTARPAILLKTNVTSMPLSACNATLSEYNQQVDHPSLRSGISDSQFCAYDPKASNDACQGDSGGPLQTFSSPAIGTVVGVVSFGISCGTSLPSVYTRVAHFLSWIESIVWPISFKDFIKWTLQKHTKSAQFQLVIRFVFSLFIPTVTNIGGNFYA